MRRAQRAVSAVLDLRRKCSPCTIRSRDLLQLVRPGRYARRQNPRAYQELHPAVTSCSICESRLSAQLGQVTTTKVFHLDLVTPGFKCQVFKAVPLGTKLQAICRLATFRSPESVFAQKCADPNALGYEKLYVMFLEHSKKKIAQAFNLLEQEENYPVLIHCVHGKDRTGMIVMLLLLLCGVDEENIVSEYMISASCMTSWREKGNDELAAHLQTTQVLSVEKEYIHVAINHIQFEYKGVQNYLLSCGVSTTAQDTVKELLQMEGYPVVAHAVDEDLPSCPDDDGSS